MNYTFAVDRTFTDGIGQPKYISITPRGQYIGISYCGYTSDEVKKLINQDSKAVTMLTTRAKDHIVL